MVIHRLRDLANVNAIADGQKLAFEPVGVNVIWGGNGAGKTGYSRILKHAGRTLYRETVLTNVTEEESGAPAATVDISIGEKSHNVALDLTATAPALLGRICIADAKSGEAYLTQETEVDYVPTTLSSLSRLADGLLAVKAILQQRLDELRLTEIDPHSFGSDTAVAKLLAGLTHETPDELIVSLANLSEAELEQQAALRKRVGEIDAMQAPQLREAAERDVKDAERLSSDLQMLTVALAEPALEAARELRRGLAETREAAELIAKGFQQEPLAGVGTEPWRVLWKAAREFAAHLGEKLPPDHSPAHCPLCMQELTTEARTRLDEFERFVEGDVNARLGEMEAKLEEDRERLPDVDIVRVRNQGSIERLGIELGEPGHTILGWLEGAKASIARLSTGDFDGLLPIGPAEDLGPWIAKRRGDAERHAAIERGEENEKARRGLAELDARHQLGLRLADVLAHLAILREIEHIRTAMAKTSTNAVSRKITALSQELVQAGLEKALKRQLRALDFRGLEVVPRTRTVEGKPRVSLCFEAVDDGPLTGVLSVGEQRRLALAMFLAEMEVLSDLSPVIFDDPTSSIDQEGRRHIAATLGRLGKARQVIVFTHELSFVHELRKSLSDVVPLHIQHVCRVGDTVGHVRPSLPWEGLPSSERNGPLRQRLEDVKRAEKVGDPTSIATAVLEFCRYLRDSFERTVEDRVLAGSITRRDDSVHTQKLDQIVCTEEICSLVDDGMSRVSRWLHDRAMADGSAPPTVDELQDCLNIYIELQKKLSTAEEDRRKDAKGRRKQRIKSMKAADASRSTAGSPTPSTSSPAEPLRSVPGTGDGDPDPAGEGSRQPA